MSYTQKQIKALVEDPHSWKDFGCVDSMGVLVKELDFMGHKYRKIYLWQKRYTPRGEAPKYEYSSNEEIYPYDTASKCYLYPIRKTMLCNILYELAKEEEK